MAIRTLLHLYTRSPSLCTEVTTKGSVSAGSTLLFNQLVKITTGMDKERPTDPLLAVTSVE